MPSVARAMLLNFLARVSLVAVCLWEALHDVLAVKICYMLKVCFFVSKKDSTKIKNVFVIAG
jgi:hypothetical protein